MIKMTTKMNKKEGEWKMETEKSVDDMIDKLYKQKEELPEFSAFGGNNWVVIDSQIEALNWVLGIGDPLVEPEEAR